MGLLLDFGADINETGEGGRPPLISAAASCLPATVTYLLDRGAPIDAQDIMGNTALHEAVKLEDPVAVVNVLLRRGIGVNARNKSGLKAIQVAMAQVPPNVLALEALGGRIADNGELEDEGGLHD